MSLSRLQSRQSSESLRGKDMRSRLRRPSFGGAPQDLSLLCSRRRKRRSPLRRCVPVAVGGLAHFLRIVPEFLRCLMLEGTKFSFSVRLPIFGPAPFHCAQTRVLCSSVASRLEAGRAR